MTGLSAREVERFWSHVEKTDTCWLWKLSVGSHGYGQTWLHGHVTVAHRVAYMLAKGEIPNNLLVCHTCDNKLCVNPSHLFLGTDADNKADCVAKGRQPSGEKHYRARLTQAQVSTIAARVGSGEIQRKVAKEYGVARTTISSIVNGHSWRRAA